MFCFWLPLIHQMVLFFSLLLMLFFFLPTHRKFPFFCHGSYMLVIKSSGSQQEKTGLHCWNDKCFQLPPPGICARFMNLAQAAALKADFYIFTPGLMDEGRCLSCQRFLFGRLLRSMRRLSLHVKGRRAITLCMEKLCDTFMNHSLVFHFQLFFFIFFGSAPQWEYKEQQCAVTSVQRKRWRKVLLLGSLSPGRACERSATREVLTQRAQNVAALDFLINGLKWDRFRVRAASRFLSKCQFVCELPQNKETLNL